MKLDTNKEKGNAGLSMAIAYFGSNGYSVAIPLNDTQGYDLIVDNGEKLQKVQIKCTNNKTVNGYVCSLRTISGTSRKSIRTVKETDVDLLFVLCGDLSMYLIPTADLVQASMITLYKERHPYNTKSFDCRKYRIDL